ncbi:MAG: elongation factor P [Candidatus Gracilibacteria bacterium]
MSVTTEIKKGSAIVLNGNTCLIVSTQFVNPGKGAAFTRAKLKNLRTGQVVESTFKSGEAIEVADVQYKKCQYLYKDGQGYNFMDNETYEQFTLSMEDIAETGQYLKDGTVCYALYIDNNPISIQLPPKMDFKVVSADPGVKGDSASGANKDCEVETGLKVKVPLFIKEGDMIKVNTETGEYDSKVN